MPAPQEAHRDIMMPDDWLSDAENGTPRGI